jgi:hypothetical protein
MDVVTLGMAKAATKGKIVDPDDIGFDVVLVVGQSNAVGYGPTKDTTYLDPPSARIWQYAATGTYTNQVIQAIDPLQHQEPAGATNVGHAMSFARDYIRSIPENRQVLLVPSAKGSTGFTPQSSFSWDPDYVAGTNLYNLAVAQATAAVNLNPKNRIVAILWTQGETDAGMTGSAYGAKVSQLIDGFRAAIPGAANAPFIIQQMVPEGIETRTGFPTINAVHIDTQRTKVRTAFTYGPRGMFNTTDVPDPAVPIHYNGQGQRTLGSRIYASLILARANVLGTPPVAPASPVLVQSGTSINLSWARTPGRVTDYKVEYRTNAGSWLALTRAQSVDVTATITGLTLGTTVDVRVSSINEAGTSAPSTAATIAMVNLAGQVTGLAAGSPGRGTIPLSWTATATATGYRVEYKKTADSVWTTGPLVTGTSTTVSLDFNTAYDLRVSAVNAAGNGTPSAAVSATTLAMELLSDVIATAMFTAHSLRVVKSGYAGPLIRVRRSSDNTELDINATASKVLDTAALLAFAGSGDAYLTKWYDQSGNARDHAQATTTKQPKIVAAGAVITKNGRPAARFGEAGALTSMKGAFSGLLAAGSMSGLSVYTNPPAGQAVTMVLAMENNTASEARVLFEAIGSGGSVPTYQIVNSAGTGVGTINGTASVKDASLHQFSRTDSGTSASIWQDGAVSAAPTAYTRTGTLTVTGTQIGAYIKNVDTVDSLPYIGDVLEIVTFASVISTPNRQAGEANQKSFAAIA